MLISSYCVDKELQLIDAWQQNFKLHEIYCWIQSVRIQRLISVVGCNITDIYT